MRSVFLASALALSGCLDPAPVAPPAAADAEAFALLAHVDRDAVAGAFDALDALPYRAERTTTLLDDGAEVGTERTVVAVTPDGLTLEARDVSGALADAEAEPRGARDPLETALSDDPPYLEGASREAYRVAVLGDTLIDGARFRLVEAVLADADRELGVRRVWAAVDADGRVAAVEVERTADSVLFDEVSRVRVDLRRVGGAWLPARVETDAQTDVPLSAPVRLRTAWVLTPGS